MRVQDANRARAALAYVDQKLQGLIEYATWSCLDDMVPDLQSTLDTMRRLAKTPSWAIPVRASTPHEVVIPREGD